MFVFLCILGFGIILWPVISGAIAYIFNGVVLIISSPFYWIMRIFKRPKNEEEDKRMSSISVTLAFISVIVTTLTLMIIKSL